jgi:hypothetical protein
MFPTLRYSVFGSLYRPSPGCRQVVKSGAFSGATGCEGIRKSVKFELAAAPFIIEISSVTAYHRHRSDAGVNAEIWRDDYS